MEIAPQLPADPSPPTDPALTPDPPNPNPPNPGTIADPSPPSDPAADPPPAPDPAAEAATAARAVVPESADKYVITAAEAVKPYLGGPDDPAMKELREFAHTQKWDQGRMDDQIQLLQHFADKGLLGETFSPAAEIAKLGETGQGQMQEQDFFLQAMKAKGVLDADTYGELASLTVTANGVKALAALRKQFGAAQTYSAPTDVPASGDPYAEAKAMRRDDRYGKDRTFTAQADKAWEKAAAEAKP